MEKESNVGWDSSSVNQEYKNTYSWICSGRVEVSVKVVVVHWAGDHVNTVILRCVFDQQNLLKILPESCTNTHDQLPDSNEKKHDHKCL